jgi:hypothetical protein
LLITDCSHFASLNQKKHHGILSNINRSFQLVYLIKSCVLYNREIQECLVEIGDKEASFIGSQEWIGAIELSFVLDKLLGVRHFP